jgi:hypothetical protein
MVQGRVAAFFELRDGLRQQGRRATARPVFSFLRHEGRAAWDRRNAGPWGAPLLFGWLLGTVRKSWFQGRVAAFFELRDGLRQQGGRATARRFFSPEGVPLRTGECRALGCAPPFWVAPGDGTKVMVQGRVAAFCELRDGLRQQGGRATARPVFSFLRHEKRAAWDRRDAGPWEAPLLSGGSWGWYESDGSGAGRCGMKRLRDGLRQQGRKCLCDCEWQTRTGRAPRCR